MGHAIADLRTLVDERIKTLFGAIEGSRLYPPMWHPIEAGGKRLRPLLVLLSSMGVGGKPEDALDVAVAIELFHTFTLVHDDIMDHDTLRRGRPTVHALWDAETAILAGDGLLILAYRTLQRSDHPEILRVERLVTEALFDLCEGQALDKAFEKGEAIFLNDYLDMIDKKTARLLEVSCRAGAILGGARPEEERALAQFGRSLGLAFQIQDDLLDVISEEGVLGKPLLSDLRERKRTYLTTALLTGGHDAVREDFLTYWKKPQLTETDVQAMRDLLFHSGVVEAAKRAFEDRLEEALASLDHLPETDARNSLKSLAKGLRDRLS